MFYGVIADTPAEQAVGKECLEVLDQHYPGHLWHVLVRQGVIQIKNLNFSEKWGMVRKLKDIQHDALERKKSYIMAAGEFLERAHLRRGKRDDKAASVEGIPQGHFRG